MTRPHAILTLSTLVALSLLVGCGRPERHAVPARQGVPITELSEVVVTDPRLASALLVAAPQERHDTAGHMVVDTAIENTTASPLVLGVRTVFRRGDQTAAGDATPWRRVALDPGVTASYTVRSLSTDTEAYSIEIRPQR